jgi:hypothetical protein
MKPGFRSFSVAKFNPWIFVYWKLALECKSDVLKALLFHWPLLMDFGDDMKNRKAAMQRMVSYLQDVFWTMHEPFGFETSVYKEGNPQDSMLGFFTGKKFGDWDFSMYWDKQNGRFSITRSLRYANGEHVQYDLFVLFKKMPDASEIETEWPVAYRLGKAETTEGKPYSDKMQVLVHEPMSLFHYKKQLHELLTQFMALTPEYWRHKGNLPEHLNF